MAETKIRFASMEEYISSFPGDIRKGLQAMRETIRKAAPEAEEVISYQMPAFRQGQVLLFFSAWKDHYSLFVPSDAALAHFGKWLAKYEVHKATVKIPLAGPIPHALIAALTKHRVREAAGSKAGGSSKGVTKGKVVGKGKKKVSARAKSAGRKAGRKAGA